MNDYSLFMHRLLASFLVLLFLPFSEAATLHGTVYDASLDRAKDIMIDISTIPKQRYISKDGIYSFKVSTGNYTVHVQQLKNEDVIAQATELAMIGDNNDYRLDIILFPKVQTLDELLGESIFDVEKIALENNAWPWWLWLFIGIGSVVAGAVVFALLKKERKEMVMATPTVVHELDKLLLAKSLPQKSEEKRDGQEPKEQKDELEEVVSFIKNADGRTTQKDLRKHFLSSEAKISLMVTELEHKGVIEKIKKGRGNILILKEKL